MVAWIALFIIKMFFLPVFEWSTDCFPSVPEILALDKPVFSSVSVFRCLFVCRQPDFICIIPFSAVTSFEPPGTWQNHLVFGGHVSLQVSGSPNSPRGSIQVIESEPSGISGRSAIPAGSFPLETR
ncbi:hypothetical protein P170DRAFT_136420 [Aspergillus steynii IBT 23096]|uniref:Secreted protein n=1 Tax=Aspergillus steynii IBT 23096 TaxID=1392250 RepID=A0A2I2GB75_9EURO|nr:uncharacterized protein P170DRAFT_136420 [Aspergillus steynii IBT 23096]PLB50133.1 hypothetical protein P170DRAFT_136420 [Aspergillus steynii IBT 23096]